MNIILIDNKIGLAKKHAATLGLNGHAVWYWDVNEAMQWNGSKFANASGAPTYYDLALVHIGDIQSLDAATNSCQHVVIYSGGGNAKHDLHACIKPPVSIDSPIPAGALYKICEWVCSSISDDQWRKSIEELFNDEPLMAFRLLRAAKAFCGDKESLTFPDSDLVIHSPTTLSHWLEPFKTDSSTGFTQLAELILGEDKSEAANGVKDAISSKGDLEAEVIKYLKISPVTSQS
jgi:hypothetical protein